MSKRAWLLLSSGVVAFLLLLSLLDLAFLTTEFARSSERDTAAMRAAVKKVRADLVAMESGVDRVMASGDSRGLNEFNHAYEHFPKDSRAIDLIATHMDPRVEDAAKRLVVAAQVMAQGASTYSHMRAANAKIARDIAHEHMEDLAKFDVAEERLSATVSAQSLTNDIPLAMIASAVCSIALAVLLVLVARSRRPTGLVDAKR